MNRKLDKAIEHFEILMEKSLIRDIDDHSSLEIIQESKSYHFYKQIIEYLQTRKNFIPKHHCYICKEQIKTYVGSTVVIDDNKIYHSQCFMEKKNNDK